MLSKDISENAPKGAQTPYQNALLGMIPMPEKAFGRWRVALSEGKLGPVAKIYDLKQDKLRFPGGQHVCDYYVKTLLGKDDYSEDIRLYSALLLYGGCDDWTIKQPDLTDIANWIEQMTEGSL